MPQVLTHHPATPCAAVRALSADIARLPDGVLALDFLLEGAIAQLRIPARRPGVRSGELWKHTCFEAFIALGDEPGYFEINLAPSGDWAVYQFTGYRAGMAPSEALGTPQISVRADQGRLQLEARFVAGGTAPFALDATRVALATVVEAEDGRLSYWALRHPPGKPDFHHPDGFVLGI
jgi:hypothetical protein